MKLSRAGLLAVCALTAFAASDFWNKKDPAEWSQDEVLAFKTKSPWAKKVHLDIGAGGRGRGEAAGSEGGGISAESGGLSGAAPSSGRGSRGGIRPGEDSSMGGGGGIDIVVRWESSAPVMAATKLQLPPAMANDYIVSVTGLPRPLMQAIMMKGLPQTEDAVVRQKAAVDNLLHSASLTAKGKDSQAPELVVQTTDKTAILFAFPKRTAGISGTDKEVQFVMTLPATPIKVKFDPREMTYKGASAL